MKNVTVSIPEDLLKESREYARKHGTSLNELIRSLLKQHVNLDARDPVGRLLAHTERTSINTRNWKWNRDEIYDREIFS